MGVNAYVWHPLPSQRENGEPILFDCGYPWSGRGLVASLTALGCPPEEVRTIAITHDDIDHVGRLASLQAVSSATVIAHRIEAEAAGRRQVAHPDRRQHGGKLDQQPRRPLFRALATPARAGRQAGGRRRISSGRLDGGTHAGAYTRAHRLLPRRQADTDRRRCHGALGRRSLAVAHPRLHGRDGPCGPIDPKAGRPAAGDDCLRAQRDFIRCRRRPARVCRFVACPWGRKLRSGAHAHR